MVKNRYCQFSSVKFGSANERHHGLCINTFDILAPLDGPVVDAALEEAVARLAALVSHRREVPVVGLQNF